MLRKFFIFLFISIFLVSCEKKNEWIPLFDGKSIEGWRGYNSNSMPPGWTAKDGMLMFDTELELEQNYVGGKDIIYGKQKFTEFEFY